MTATAKATGNRATLTTRRRERRTGRPDGRKSATLPDLREDEEGNPAPIEQDWKQKTAAAAQIAKAMGNMPGSMARDVAEALKPKVDVRSLLLRFFSERSTGDYSWTRHLTSGT